MHHIGGVLDRKRVYLAFRQIQRVMERGYRLNPTPEGERIAKHAKAQADKARQDWLNGQPTA